MKININEATAPQLVAFAQSHLNIEGVSTSMAKQAIIAKMRAVQYDQDTIEVEDRAPLKQATPEGDAAEGEGTVTIIIPSDDKPGGQQPVWVSVNEKGMFIPRDQECTIPKRYYEVLKNAVRQVYAPLADGGLSEPRDVPAYSFSKVG